MQADTVHADGNQALSPNRTRSRTRRVVSTAGAIALGAALALGIGSTAYAAAINADLSLAEASLPVIAPGTSGTLTVVATNNGPGTMNGNEVWQPLVFNAPVGTTFANNALNGVVANGTSFTLTTCVLSNGNTTLTCPGPNQVSGPAWTPGTNASLSVTVAVPATAPANSTLSGGSVSWTESTTNGDVWTDANQSNNTNIALAVVTPPSSGTPMLSAAGLGASGAVAAGAGLLVLGVRRRRAKVSLQT